MGYRFCPLRSLIRQTSADTFIAANDQHTGPESSAIIIAGRRRSRVLPDRAPAGNASDAVDAKLIGVRLFVTTNVNYDA
jgi:hypothetical protein